MSVSCVDLVQAASMSPFVVLEDVNAGNIGNRGFDVELYVVMSVSLALQVDALRLSV